MTHIERDSWSRDERRRVDEALSRARFWQSVEPHTFSFWEVVDDALLAHYPKCRFKRDEQVTLGDFPGGVG